MYGYVPKPLSFKGEIEPIDALINHCDAHYISWDLSGPKFIKEFKRLYPDWYSRVESVSEILIHDLEESIRKKSQPVGLLEKLIKLTIDSRMFDTSTDIEFDDPEFTDP